MTTHSKHHALYQQVSRESVALRIRTLRKSRGWTLADVEKISEGRIKAVVIGSYERCDRSMDLDRAIQIADLFGLPLSELLTPTNPHNSLENQGNALIIDLRRAKQTVYDEAEMGKQFTLFLSWIIALRQDWNGEVLSLRNADVEVIGLMLFKSSSGVLAWLTQHDLIIKT